MFHLSSEKNKFGFYECGNFKSYSKIETLECSNKTGNQPVWNFNIKNYQNFNWKVEPEEDLWNLYTDRAKEIREKYDYVVIMFSGGADSSNVVDVFIKNNIKIDEICTYHQLGGSKDVNNYMDKEVFKIAQPRAKEIVEQHPEINFRLYDWSNLTLKLLKNQDVIERFVYRYSKYMTPSNICRHHLRKEIDDWNQIIQSGKKLVLVWGGHKPAIKAQADGRNSYVYHDSNEFLIPVETQDTNIPEYYDELFYNPENSPIIACKQSHLIKKTCLNDPKKILVDFDWYDKNKEKVSLQDWLNMTNGNIWINGKKFRLDREGLHSVIYPYWDTKTYTDGKPNSWIRNPRDNWLYNQNIPELEQLQKNIKETFDRIGSRWWKDPTNYLKGIPSFHNYYTFD